MAIIKDQTFSSFTKKLEAIETLNTQLEAKEA